MGVCVSVCMCALSTLARQPASIVQISARLPPVPCGSIKHLVPRREEDEGRKVGLPFVTMSCSRKEKKVDGGGRGDESS